MCSTKFPYFTNSTLYYTVWRVGLSNRIQFDWYYLPTSCLFFVCVWSQSRFFIHVICISIRFLQWSMDDLVWLTKYGERVAPFFCSNPILSSSHTHRERGYREDETWINIWIWNTYTLTSQLKYSMMMEEIGYFGAIQRMWEHDFSGEEIDISQCKYYIAD